MRCPSGGVRRIRPGNGAVTPGGAARPAGGLLGALVPLLPLLVAGASVLPGLYDTTLTSRLAVYPLCGILLLWAGRAAVPGNALLLGGGMLLLPALGLLWAPIPLQGIPQLVRWGSFGLMLAGAAGVARMRGEQALLVALLAAALLASAIELALPGDMPWGNPNRIGPLLSTGLVAAAAGAVRRPGWLWAALSVPLVLALASTGFRIAWIASGLGLAWLLLCRVSGRAGLWAGWLLIPMLAGQAVLTAMPGTAGRVDPSLELRCLVWRGGLEQLGEDMPLGTGTGQSRLYLMQSAGPAAAELAGDPDRRVDHLHSELLTPAVEWGLPGLLLAAGLLTALLRRKLPAAAGALLVSSWPFLAADLPLANPLGALPPAMALGLAISVSGERRSVRLPLAAPGLLALPALAWGFLVTAGYSSLEQGRLDGIRGLPAQAAGAFERTTALVPWEERAHLFLTRARLDQGANLAAVEAADRLNSLYPTYWRGHVLEAQALAGLGRVEEAASSWLRAAMLAPPTLPDRPLLALNALACPPDDADSLEAAASVTEGIAVLAGRAPAEVRLQWAARLLDSARLLAGGEPLLASDLLMEAANTVNGTDPPAEGAGAMLDSLESAASELGLPKAVRFFRGLR